METAPQLSAAAATLLPLLLMTPVGPPSRDPRPEPTGMSSKGNPRMTLAGPPSRKTTACAAPEF